MMKYRASPVVCAVLSTACAGMPTLRQPAERAVPAEHAVPADGRAIMTVAARVLEQADALEADAALCLRRGNSLRKQVAQVRALQRQSVAAPGKSHQVAADALAEELEGWQKAGASLRQRSQRLRADALTLLIDGFHSSWHGWISNPAPLTMATDGKLAMAHNAPQRSVHPGMLGLRPQARDLPVRHQGMSIPVPALVGQSAPTELNVSSFKVSRKRVYFTHIEVEPRHAGEVMTVPLNAIHRWRLLVSSLSGDPVADARIEVGGHMPGHVHGLPTKPEVTEEIAPGVYRVDGMKFQMQGWWVITFTIEDGDTVDTVQFNLLL